MCVCVYAQAAADGSLPVLVQKLRSQPQILTAYARDAPLRQPATVDALVAALQELQVCACVAAGHTDCAPNEPQRAPACSQQPLPFTATHKLLVPCFPLLPCVVAYTLPGTHTRQPL